MSNLNQLLSQASKFPWAVVIIVSIISITSLIIFFAFLRNKSIIYVEWGNAILKLKLKRGDEKNIKS